MKPGRNAWCLVSGQNDMFQIMSRSMLEFKTLLPKLDIIIDKMKSFDYKNPKITALRNSIIFPL